MQDGVSGQPGKPQDTASERETTLIGGKSSFVIMPFGAKPHLPSAKTIDFDKVYEWIIKPAALRLALDCRRSDEERGAGLIHKGMVERILSAEVAIVDITTLKPNVLYELGVRHTARRSGTIIIRQKGDPIPFNINGMRAFDYEFDDANQSSDANRGSIDNLVTVLKAALIDRQIDSLVHGLVPRLNVSLRPTPFATRHTFVWRSAKNSSLEFAITRGHILKIDTVDAWVNHENTKMQMGRFHDNSISACVRYFGAKRDEAGHVTRDVIERDIRRQLKGRPMVEPGTPIITKPGSLATSHNLKAVIHVAALHGEPGNGYVMMRGYADCVMNVIEAVGHYNAAWQTRWKFRPPLRSILFPLMGTQGEREPQDVTDNLVRAARDYLETWSECGVTRVVFLAYTDRDDELCETAFRRLGLQFVRDEAAPPASSATASGVDAAAEAAVAASLINHG